MRQLYANDPLQKEPEIGPKKAETGDYALNESL